MLFRLCLIVLLASVSSARLFGQDTATVPATADLFAAGEAESTGGGTEPIEIQLPQGKNRKLVFKKVTGAVAAHSNAPLHDADGVDVFAGVVGTDIESKNFVSGIVHNSKQMFLAGVFFGEKDGHVVPDRLQFDGKQDHEFIEPKMGQSFFIGNGKTAKTSKLQEIRIPDDATRLYLGFIDAYDQETKKAFRGNPGAYDGNKGELKIEIVIK